jgi:hypothetical protein
MIHLRRSTVVRAGIAVAVLAALGIGLAIGLLVNSPSSSQSKSAASTTTTTHPSTTTTAAPATTTTAAPTTTTANPAFAILSPQTTPPVSAECSITLTDDADGNVSPILCANGGINVPAWNYYAANHLAVMSLGPSATSSQVLNAMCSDTSTNPIEENAEQLVSHYNGWPFGNDTEFTEFLAQNCPG